MGFGKLSIMNDDQTFRLEEYKSLRKEIELYLTESRSQERYTLIAVGAIWAWLVINRLTSGLLWSVPIVLTVATSIRMIAILLHFTHMGEIHNRAGNQIHSHRVGTETEGLDVGCR